jgi:hypothetical protein
MKAVMCSTQRFSRESSDLANMNFRHLTFSSRGLTVAAAENRENLCNEFVVHN